MRLTQNFGSIQRYWTVAVLVTASLLIAVACGGSATSEQDAAPAQVNTPVPATAVPATSIPTAIPEIAGKSFEFPLVPQWVSQAK